MATELLSELNEDVSGDFLEEVSPNQIVIITNFFELHCIFFIITVLRLFFTLSFRLRL